VRLPERAAVLLLALTLAGCSASPPPAVAPAPPAGAIPPPASGPRPETGFTHIISGGADSVGAAPGSPNALYQYRFRQIDPGSERFTYQDRDLSFYFRPAPDALYFQVENRQDRQVWIDWDRSTFEDPFGRTEKVGTADSRWETRLGGQAPTQISGLQRYSNYLFPMSYLLDPAGSGRQLRRPLFPEDNSAPQYVDRQIAVSLMFRIEDRVVPYQFRFKVSSVITR
jgi:hypothetical protein